MFSNYFKDKESVFYKINIFAFCLIIVSSIGLHTYYKYWKNSDNYYKINYINYTSNKMTLRTLLNPEDPSSFSRPDQIATESLHISLEINFSRKILVGKVILTLKKIQSNVSELFLDVKDLNIFQIYDIDTGETLPYTQSCKLDDIGSRLGIQLSENTKKIAIHYETSPEATALQWLSAVQTSGKKIPFMFSQCQAIEARSIIPCQDTPAVKIPYSADIRAPREFTVLMSAKRVNTPFDLQDDTRIHQFQQDVPIPSYLIALAAGALVSKRLGPRSEVWAEKELIEQSAYEFAETENMLQIAENICGPYLWGVYDLLVLPPSFAYGGMENPCLTFVTPTLLAGDRSLAYVVAHEISHSWTGNLVTNANFEHFWLNEGFTTMVERKIIGRMKGDAVRDFNAVIGVVELQDTINKIGEKNPLTNLVVDLSQNDPSDAFSQVPYEKGQLFLLYLEELVGGQVPFEKFLKKYLKHFEYKSIKTDDFKNFFISYFKENKNINAIKWDEWFFKPGMPPTLPKLDHSLSDFCTEFKNLVIQCTNRDEFFNNPKIRNLKSSMTFEVTQILNQLIAEKPLPIEKLNWLEQLLNLNETNNSEFKLRWLRLCLRSRWNDKIQPAIDFVNSNGRMKYVNPIYRELYDWEVSRPHAIENYNKHKDQYMHVTRRGISKILHVDL